MESQDRTSSFVDMEKQNNSQPIPPEDTVTSDNKNIDAQGKLEPDKEKEPADEAAPENKTEQAPELPSAYRRFFIFVAVCLSIFLVRRRHQYTTNFETLLTLSKDIFRYGIYISTPTQKH
jgi:hypothetical protein